MTDPRSGAALPAAYIATARALYPFVEWALLPWAGGPYLEGRLSRDDGRVGMYSELVHRDGPHRGEPWEPAALALTMVTTLGRLKPFPEHKRLPLFELQEVSA